MFTMYTGDAAFVQPRFEVCAIDNQGMRDPTPAIETFSLSNTAPVVQFTDALDLGDSTYASVTFHWVTTDPDGGGPGLHYYVWLDGNEATPDSTSETAFTVPSRRFLQQGTYLSGPRTVFVQAVDDGGRHGPAASFTWFVRAPGMVLDDNQARLLVIDDVVETSGNNQLIDAFYKGGDYFFARDGIWIHHQGPHEWLQDGTWDSLRVQYNANMFRSAEDMLQTFRQFKAVVWYRGDNLNISPWLTNYSQAIKDYVDGGGRLYVDGVYLISALRTPGALGRDFIDYLDSDSLLECYSSAVQNPTEGWGNVSGGYFRSAAYGEITRFSAAANLSGNTGGLRAFVVRDTMNVAFWALPNSLSPSAGFEVPVAVTVPHGAGRIVLSTIPLSSGYSNLTRLPSAGNVYHRILQQFGIAP
jgi:hypothetical protein